MIKYILNNILVINDKKILWDFIGKKKYYRLIDELWGKKMVPEGNEMFVIIMNMIGKKYKDVVRYVLNMNVNKCLVFEIYENLVCENKVELFRWMKEEVGINLDEKDLERNNFLEVAVNKDYIEITKYLLNHFEFKKGVMRCFTLSCKKGVRSIVELFLQEDIFNQEALIIISERGYDNILKLFLEYKRMFDDSTIHCAVNKAIINGHYNIFKTLICEYKIELSPEIDDFKDSYCRACNLGKEEMVKVLVKNFGFNPFLGLSSSIGYINIVKYLVGCIEENNLVYDHGQVENALTKSVASNDYKALKILMKLFPKGECHQFKESLIKLAMNNEDQKITRFLQKFDYPFECEQLKNAKRRWKKENKSMIYQSKQDIKRSNEVSSSVPVGLKVNKRKYYTNFYDSLVNIDDDDDDDDYYDNIDDDDQPYPLTQDEKAKFKKHKVSKLMKNKTDYENESLFFKNRNYNEGNEYDVISDEDEDEDNSYLSVVKKADRMKKKKKKNKKNPRDKNKKSNRYEADFPELKERRGGKIKKRVKIMNSTEVEGVSYRKVEKKIDNNDNKEVKEKYTYSHKKDIQDEKVISPEKEKNKNNHEMKEKYTYSHKKDIQDEKVISPEKEKNKNKNNEILKMKESKRKFEAILPENYEKGAIFNGGMNNNNNIRSENIIRDQSKNVEDSKKRNIQKDNPIENINIKDECEDYHQIETLICFSEEDSRYLSRVTRNPDRVRRVDITAAFNLIKHNIMQLSTRRVSHHYVSFFLNYGNEKQRNYVTEVLMKDRNVFILVKSHFGEFVLQNLFLNSSVPNQIKILEMLKKSIVDLAHDSIGYHFLICVINECFDPYVHNYFSTLFRSKIKILHSCRVGFKVLWAFMKNGYQFIYDEVIENYEAYFEDYYHFKVAFLNRFMIHYGEIFIQKHTECFLRSGCNYLIYSIKRNGIREGFEKSLSGLFKRFSFHSDGSRLLELIFYLSESPLIIDMYLEEISSIFKDLITRKIGANIIENILNNSMITHDHVDRILNCVLTSDFVGLVRNEYSQYPLIALIQIVVNENMFSSRMCKSICDHFNQIINDKYASYIVCNFIKSCKNHKLIQKIFHVYAGEHFFDYCSDGNSCYVMVELYYASDEIGRNLMIQLINDNVDSFVNNEISFRSYIIIIEDLMRKNKSIEKIFESLMSYFHSMIKNANELIDMCSICYRFVNLKNYELKSHFIVCLKREDDIMNQILNESGEMGLIEILSHPQNCRFTYIPKSQKELRLEKWGKGNKYSKWEDTSKETIMSSKDFNEKCYNISRFNEYQKKDFMKELSSNIYEYCTNDSYKGIIELIKFYGPDIDVVRCIFISLRGHFLSLTTKDFSSRILLTLINRLEHEHLAIGIIIKEFRGRLCEISMNEYGSKIVVRLIELNSENVMFFINELVSKNERFFDLAKHINGMESIKSLWRNSRKERSIIMNHFLQQISNFCRTKNGSLLIDYLCRNMNNGGSRIVIDRILKELKSSLLHEFGAKILDIFYTFGTKEQIRNIIDFIKMNFSLIIKDESYRNVILSGLGKYPEINNFVFANYKTKMRIINDSYGGWKVFEALLSSIKIDKKRNYLINLFCKDVQVVASTHGVSILAYIEKMLPNSSFFQTVIENLLQSEDLIKKNESLMNVYKICERNCNEDLRNKIQDARRNCLKKMNMVKKNEYETKKRNIHEKGSGVRNESFVNSRKSSSSIRNSSSSHHFANTGFINEQDELKDMKSYSKMYSYQKSLSLLLRNLKTDKEKHNIFGLFFDNIAITEYFNKTGQYILGDFLLYGINSDVEKLVSKIKNYFQRMIEKGDFELIFYVLNGLRKRIGKQREFIEFFQTGINESRDIRDGLLKWITVEEPRNNFPNFKLYSESRNIFSIIQFLLSKLPRRSKEYVLHIISL